MIHSGDPVNHHADTAVRHVLLSQGVLGIKVKVMLPWDPSEDDKIIKARTGTHIKIIYNLLSCKGATDHQRNFVTGYSVQPITLMKSLEKNGGFGVDKDEEVICGPVHRKLEQVYILHYDGIFLMFLPWYAARIDYWKCFHNDLEVRILKSLLLHIGYQACWCTDVGLGADLQLLLLRWIEQQFPGYETGGAELKNTFAHYIIDALKWSVPKHLLNGLIPLQQAPEAPAGQSELHRDLDTAQAASTLVSFYLWIGLIPSGQFPEQSI
ncbi:hypothetical protein GH733_001898 [Mirounga leonina]|nr:hypothetical protein GH733_001898 [Mirounga leonina]